jgi:dipeptidase E
VKLAFYSGGHEEENVILDSEVVRLLPKKKNLKLAYIPSCSYESEQEYFSFIENFERFQIRRFFHFPIDIPFDRTLLSEVLKCDLIHLAGGNTFYFLKYMKESGFFPHLLDFVHRGGVLTGLSAGGILMTSRIDTASFPDFDCDDNDEKVTNWNALNLVPFEFFPHYRNSKRYDQALLQYSRKSKRPIYGCYDGSGIIVLDHQVSFVGQVYCFYQGRKVSVINAKY